MASRALRHDHQQGKAARFRLTMAGDRLAIPAPECKTIAMRNTRFAIALALTCAAPAVLAEDATPPASTARYSFNQVNDGFLRLDNQSGQVAYCSSTSVGWACQAVPEDRAALEKEIARLQEEVAGLKTEISALRESPPAPRPPADLSSPADKRDDAARLREDMERAR